MDINISSQIVVQTAAQWAADNTVYSNKRILVTSDAYYGSTDQRKFKIADGVQTWSNLDYMPIGAETLAEVLANGNTTNELAIQSNDSGSVLIVNNGFGQFAVTGNRKSAELYVTDSESKLYFVHTITNKSGTASTTETKTSLQHTDLIELDAPTINLPQGTASKFLKTDASKNITYVDSPVDVNTIGTAINGATSATPNDTDLVMSVDTSVAKKNTWTQIKAFLKTYFDTVYQAAGSYLTSANITQTITNGVTDKAPSEDAVFDALALKANLTDSRFGSTFQCFAAVTNLLASTSYNFGCNPTLTASTNTAGRVFSFMNTGTVTKVQLTITLTGTVGSSQACDVYLRNVTTATDNLLGQITYDQGANTTTAFLWTPSITVANTTDFWTIKITTGAFTTNPTSVYHNARIFNQT